MSRKTGIWLDTDKALIVQLNQQGEARLTKIESEVEHFHQHGGYGGSKSYLAQDARSDKKLEARKKHQLKHYFEHIFKLLDGTEEIMIIGPSEAKQGLAKELKRHYGWAEKIKLVAAADVMTDNQLIAKVKTFFGFETRKK